MQAYFSHSYRDVGVNTYFLEHFLKEDVPLCADQKSDVWCVAKLERYLWESTGFVSVIPRRPTDSDPVGFSAYIAHELSLARRARVPRLLFVDDQVLVRHRASFPDDAIPYVYDMPEADSIGHTRAIAAFKQGITRWSGARPNFRARRVTMVAAPDKALAPAARNLGEMLRSAGYDVALVRGKSSLDPTQDVQLLENILSSELCVFLGGPRLSYVDVFMAMAYAHCIPSIRLRYDARVTKAETGPDGVVRWATAEQLTAEFGRQLASFRRGLVGPVEMARSTGATEVVRGLNQMDRQSEAEDQWNPEDGSALVDHVHPELPFVQDEVNQVQRTAPLRPADRESSMERCRAIYDRLKSFRFAYEIEPQKGLAREQAIRRPTLIEAHKTATCIDMACFFAALLEASNQDALIVVVRGPDFSHALAGYRAPHEPGWDAPRRGDLRRALESGGAVLFEATGVLETDQPVGEELPQERLNRVLDFMTAKEAAARLLSRGDIEVRHVVDVRAIRRARQMT